ncbi:MAG: cytochrome c peroxidase [Gemmatimonadota bacterium]
MVAAALVTGIVVGGTACAGRPADAATHTSPAAAAVHAQHVARLDSIAARVDALAALTDPAAPVASPEALRRAFAESRAAFKRAEALLELDTPGVADALNGPALPEIDEEDGETEPRPPEGFQALEALLWPEASGDRAALHLEATRIRAHLVRARQVTQASLYDDRTVWDAVRQELARLATLAVAGFDSPAARRELPEMAAALDGLRGLLQAYRGPAAVARLDSALVATGAAIDTSRAPDEADKLGWLVHHALPAARLLPAAREAARVGVPDDRRVWRAASPTPYDAGAFDASAYARVPVDGATPERIALGEALFADPALSGDGSRACASCHVPALAFTDGLARSRALPGITGVLRNAPTLINSGLQAAQFADARAASLEDQVFNVVHDAREMRGSLDGAAARYAADAATVGRFAQAFRGTPDTVPSATGIRRALAAYLRSLEGLDAPFDRYVRGDTAALDAAARRGANLYLGKAKCGTCHFLPLTNGTVPPAFAKAELEVIGVPATPVWRGARVDEDEGKGARTRRALHRFAFKTPTIRNADRTAPYMHNGVYRTLDEVIRFYDVGGGAGLGIALDHQTLPPDRLELTSAERRDLVAFIRALSDTTPMRRPLPVAMRRPLPVAMR